MAGSGTWGTPIGACLMDTTQCLDICLCFSCTMSREMKALEGVTNEFDPMWCLVSQFCAVCMSVHIRMKTIEKYGINESLPVTIISGWCLGGCSVCQIHRELTLRNAWPGGNFLHKQPGDYSQMK